MQIVSNVKSCFLERKKKEKKEKKKEKKNITY